MKYRAEIDGLRALAVLPVILFHAGFELFSGGFVGVDIFFVISGYLITTIIISEMTEGKFSITNFYERRARRILPALFFVMAACLPFAWLWLPPSDLKDFGQSLVAVSTFSSNFLFWLESNYFDTAAELKPLLHTWSLAVEEQYYILFPIFLILTWQLGIKWITLLLFFIFLVSLGLAQWTVNNNLLDDLLEQGNISGNFLMNVVDDSAASFYLLPTRIWELLIGVFIAIYLMNRSHIKNELVNQVLSLCGFIMIAYSIIVFDERTPFPSLYALLPTIGTGLLILCAVPKTLVYNLLNWKLLVGCGLISYSAYLWHQPLLAFARHRLLEETLPLLLIITLCFTSILLAWISWRFIERPFRNKDAIPRKTIFSYAFIGIFLFSIIGVSAHLTDGFENRVNFSSDMRQSFDIKINSCKEVFIQDNERPIGCRIGAKKEAVDFIIFGDSHVLSSVELVDKLALEKGLSVVYISKGGCLPFLETHLQRQDRAITNCAYVNKQVLKLAVENSIQGIILVARWSLYAHGDYNLKGGYFLSNKKNGPFNLEDTLQRYFYEGLDKTITKYLSADIPIHILTQIPHQKVEPVSAYFLASKGIGNIEELSVTRSEFQNLNKIPMSAFARRIDDINVYNLTDIFCNRGLCDIGSANRSFYHDADHLSSFGATHLTETYNSIFSQN